MGKTQEEFEVFMRRRAEAAQAYVTGDAAPLRTLTAQHPPASFFGPQGGSIEGADKVWTAYEQGAAAFSPGGETSLEILHMSASDELAYWVGIQRAAVKLSGQSEPVRMDLRITEIFRYEGGEWRLVHRHADQVETATS